MRDRRGFHKRLGVRKQRVSAVLWAPVIRGPSVAVEVADAGMIGGEPVTTAAAVVVVFGQRDVVEEGVHVTEEGDVGVEEDAGVEVGE